MILVGQYDSPFVRRVAVTMNHYGLTFERRVLSVFTDFDAMLELSPLAKVPVLELDDGERIFDSRAILDYLDGLVEPARRLLPVAEPHRRNVLRIEAVALGLAEKVYERGVEMGRKSPDKCDPDWTARLKRQIESAAAWLEQQQPAPWYCGDAMSRADVTSATAFTFLRNKQSALAEPGAFPALEAHCTHCEAQAAFRASPYSAAEASRSGWDPARSKT